MSETIQKAMSEEMLAPVRNLENPQVLCVLREMLTQPWTPARFRWLKQQVQAGAQGGYWPKKSKADNALHASMHAIWEFLDGEKAEESLKHVAKARGWAEAAACELAWRKDGAHSDPVALMHQVERLRVNAEAQSLKRLGVVS